MKHYHQSLILSHSNDYTYTVRVFCLFQWVPYFYYWLFRAFLYCPDACSSLIDVWLKDRPCINIKPNHYYYGTLPSYFDFFHEINDLHYHNTRVSSNRDYITLISDRLEVYGLYNTMDLRFGTISHWI